MADLRILARHLYTHEKEKKEKSISKVLLRSFKIFAAFSW